MHHDFADLCQRQGTLTALSWLAVLEVNRLEAPLLRPTAPQLPSVQLDVPGVERPIHLGPVLTRETAGGTRENGIMAYAFGLDAHLQDLFTNVYQVKYRIAL